MTINSDKKVFYFSFPWNIRFILHCSSYFNFPLWLRKNVYNCIERLTENCQSNSSFLRVMPNVVVLPQFWTWTVIAETANRKPSQVDLEFKPSRLKPTWTNATFCPLYFSPLLPFFSTCWWQEGGPLSWMNDHHFT